MSSATTTSYVVEKGTGFLAGALLIGSLSSGAAQALDPLSSWNDVRSKRAIAGFGGPPAAKPPPARRTT